MQLRSGYVVSAQPGAPPEPCRALFEEGVSLILKVSPRARVPSPRRAPVARSTPPSGAGRANRFPRNPGVFADTICSILDRTAVLDGAGAGCRARVGRQRLEPEGRPAAG